MRFGNEGTPPPGGKRAEEIAQILGIREGEARDRSLKGRLNIIAKLKAARRVEIARGRAGSWLYDINRHLSLSAFLREEYADLVDFLGEPPAQTHGNTASRRLALPRASRVQP